MQHFNQDKFLIDGKSGMMYSGEFHYFRVPKTAWRRRLRQWKEAGGNVVATYVPWLIHEPEEGRFCHLELLREFLDTVTDEGVGLIVRPGPYQYSELLNDGLPEWLLTNYPQVLARNRAGVAFRHSSISYQHPLLLEKTENYFAQICPILAEYTQSHGGPIVCTQADNELFGIHYWFGDMDFNAETFGFGKEDGRYAQYLRKRFKDVDAVNERYGAKHGSFGEFGPSDEPAANGLAKFLWNRDYFDFYTGQGAEYIATLVTMMNKFGIDGQFCLNSASPRMDSWFHGFNQRLGKDFMLGSDHYYCLTQSWLQNNPTPQYFVLSYLSMEMLRMMGNPPSVLEFPFGSMSDWPCITAQDMGAALYIHAAMGMKGLNGYVYTGGPNMPGTGVTTDIYDYNAPISATGKRRPTYFELKRFGRFLADNPQLVDAEPAVDFQILMPWNAARGNAPGVTAPGLPGTIKPLDLWETGVRQGLVSAAFAAGLQPQFVDCVAKADMSKVLVVPCDGTMAASEQRALVKFIRDGGKAICLPMVPHYDDDYKPCTILADAVKFFTGDKVSQELQRPRINVGPISNVFVNDGLVQPGELPPKFEALGVDELSGQPMCIKSKLGKGEFGWLGMTWCYTNREQHQMLVWVLEQFGMKRHLLTDDGMVFAVLRGKLLFVCNLSTTPRKVNIDICADGRRIALRVPAMKVLVKEI